MHVLDVWKCHFVRLGTPRCDNHFDKHHYERVNSFVEEKVCSSIIDEFLKIPFSVSEVSEALCNLKSGKAPDPDGIIAEHIKTGGDYIPSL